MNQQHIIHPNLAEYIISANQNGKWPDTPEARYALYIANISKVIATDVEYNLQVTDQNI